MHKFLRDLTVGKSLVMVLCVAWTLSSLLHWILVGNPLTPPASMRTNWGLFTFIYQFVILVIAILYFIRWISKVWNTPISKLKLRK